MFLSFYIDSVKLLLIVGFGLMIEDNVEKKYIDIGHQFMHLKSHAFHVYLNIHYHDRYVNVVIIIIIVAITIWLK